MDVDGTMTDGGVTLLSQPGETALEIKTFDAHDGQGLTLARTAGLRIATAESCTGGLIAATLTAIAGSSDVVERGFVTYSNAAKTAELGVPEGVLAAHGAVSAEVVEAMARGAVARSGARCTSSCDATSC